MVVSGDPNMKESMWMEPHSFDLFLEGGGMVVVDNM